MIGPTSSVARFGEISPLLQKNMFGAIFRGFFGIWSIFDPTLANAVAVGQIFLL